MDEVDEIIEQIKNDSTLKGNEFSSSILNALGEIFEEKGVGASKVFLLSKFNEDDNERKRLLKVISILEKSSAIMQDRSIGRLIIKSLNQLIKGGNNGNND
ncbi:MAG: hypothetical protein ABIK73_00675 [candidate division WOR-3 bacterium]